MEQNLKKHNERLFSQLFSIWARRSFKMCLAGVDILTNLLGNGFTSLSLIFMHILILACKLVSWEKDFPQNGIGKCKGSWHIEPFFSLSSRQSPSPFAHSSLIVEYLQFYLIHSRHQTLQSSFPLHQPKLYCKDFWAFHFSMPTRNQSNLLLCRMLFPH